MSNPTPSKGQPSVEPDINNILHDFGTSYPIETRETRLKRIAEAKAALNAHYLELFIACKPEKKIEYVTGLVSRLEDGKNRGFNAALDLWESNLKQRMEKE